MKTMPLKRNFSIIAHIDHGKSTLADRILEITGTVTKREMKEQILDKMDLEREKGITIKAQAVTLFYTAKDGIKYELNLIDTPGHVDFVYEVSRSLAACEGALLVVDATQGVEAQTLANLYLAIENNLEIIPVINKIDLPNSDIEKVKGEIEELVGLDATNAVLTSAKVGLGIEDLMEAIVARVPAPQDREDTLRALIFDSHFDEYKGVITYVRIFDGKIRKGDKIKIMSTGKIFEVLDTGIFSPDMRSQDVLEAGSVGYLIAGIKNIADTTVGDTITSVENSAVEALAGYRKVQPMVFAGVYPIETDDYENLKEALSKLQLNDASLIFEPETSVALGFGFRVGFLGLLHMEIIIERLRREYDLDLISTAPSVIYRILPEVGDMFEIDNPMDLPKGGVRSIEEPYVKGTVIVPNDFVGGVMELCQTKRGTYLDMKYLDATRVMISYDLPLAEIVLDFYDKLKSKTKGYASFEYEFIGYKASDLVKVDIMVSGSPVDAFSFMVHKDNAYFRGRIMVEKLKELIPKQLFEVPIQAALGSRVIARETISAMRKNVLAKCYGGDISRKKKLLDRQKEGKKRMKAIGNVEIPQEAFLAVLKLDD